MDVFDSIMKGLSEAVQYEKGQLDDVKKDRISVGPLPGYQGNEIKRIRMKQHLSQQAFANVMGVTEETVEAWEVGSSTPQDSAQKMLHQMLIDNSAPMYVSRIAEDGREQTIRQHLLGCTDYAFNIGKKYSAPEIFRMTALFHDMGKLSLEFNEYLKNSHRKKESSSQPNGYKDSREGSVIHSIQGAKFLYELQQGANDWSSSLACEISAISIVNHHGSLMDELSPSGETPFRDRMLVENDGLHYAEVLAAAEKEHIFINDISYTLRNCSIELREFMEGCEANHLNVAFMIHLLTKSVFSSLVDSDRYSAFCFEIKKEPEAETVLPPWEIYIHRLEEKISRFSEDSDINNIRHEISQKCLLAAERSKGIYILNIPTGGGKTLSSLRFALNHAKTHKMEHIIYVLPYLSVLEQTAKDIREALQIPSDDDFILEHYSNQIISENPEEAQAYRLLTDRWDSPVIITTMVPFLESIYSCKSGDLRKFHNMANSIIIFDEFQALPLKCTYLFNEAINFLHYCAGSSILLCTSTQPPLNEVQRPVNLSEPSDLISYQIEKFARLDRTRIINSMVPGGYTTDKLQQFVLHKFRREGNCLVILNTIKDARVLYRSMELYLETNPQEQIELIHLSAAMCPVHRLDVINAMKDKNQKNTLCISTQMIEAGVDVSFGCVIRAIAGLDSITQAAGRCNRNREDPNGKDVYIINIAGENLSKLPDIKCGADITNHILSDTSSDLLSPAVVKRYYKECFHKQRAQMSYPVEKAGYLYDLLSVNLKGSGSYRNNGGTALPGLRQAYQTAGELFSVSEERSIQVFVPYKGGSKSAQEYQKADIKGKKSLLRRMGRYFVSLYPYQVKWLEEHSALTLSGDEILMLDAKYYSDKLGVVLP